jgi:hypothetical protein
MDNELLKEYVGLLVERRLSETEVAIADGTSVPFGDAKHIAELEASVADLTRRRDKHRRGTEIRATFSRALQRLKIELRKAKDVAAGREPPKVTPRRRTLKAPKPK